MRCMGVMLSLCGQPHLFLVVVSMLPAGRLTAFSTYRQAQQSVRRGCTGQARAGSGGSRRHLLDAVRLRRRRRRGYRSIAPELPYATAVSTELTDRSQGAGWVASHGHSRDRLPKKRQIHVQHAWRTTSWRFPVQPAPNPLRGQGGSGMSSHLPHLGIHSRVMQQ